MEDQVDAIAFLNARSASLMHTCLRIDLLTFAARAMHLLASISSLVLVVIMQNLHLSMKFARSWTFSCSDGSCKFFSMYGSAGLLPVSVLEKEDIVLVRCLVGLIDGNFESILM